jgi:hypothetical protein
VVPILNGIKVARVFWGEWVEENAKHSLRHEFRTFALSVVFELNATPLKNSATYSGSNVSVALTPNQNLNTIMGAADFSIYWETIP